MSVKLLVYFYLLGLVSFCTAGDGRGSEADIKRYVRHVETPLRFMVDGEEVVLHGCIIKETLDSYTGRLGHPPESQQDTSVSTYVSPCVPDTHYGFDKYTKEDFINAKNTVYQDSEILGLIREVQNITLGGNRATAAGLERASEILKNLKQRCDSMPEGVKQVFDKSTVSQVSMHVRFFERNLLRQPFEGMARKKVYRKLKEGLPLAVVKKDASTQTDEIDD